jgi:hypothetical protein
MGRANRIRKYKLVTVSQTWTLLHYEHLFDSWFGTRASMQSRIGMNCRQLDSSGPQRKHEILIEALLMEQGPQRI